MTPDPKPAALQDLPPNSTFGPYRISRLLGRGGMGAVYEAEHEADGRIVALKLLTVDLDKMDARERFLREGQTAAAINHPNAVYIYGTEEIDGTPAITMELVPGGTLDEKIKERGGLPWNEAIEDILQVIDGLDAAYAAGVLHRDVKPSNCFVGAGGAVKIGDFGLSKPIDGSDQLKLTQTGLFLGTPVFSSPEQLLGETIDVRSDIYAVGVTLYSLLTGQLPYHSGSMMQVVAAVLNGVPAPITNFRKDLPQGVIDVVMKAMARKAADRFQTYEEFRKAVVALRVEELAPATIWDRLRASVVDWGLNVVLLWTISLLFLPNAFGVRGGRTSDWRQVIISLVLTLLVVGIPEAMRGMSAGKWLIGIRVLGPSGGPPGFWRETCRILILAASSFVALGMQNSSVSQNIRTVAALLTTLGVQAVMLSTVRRKNGWRMLHDILTGTRVVRPRPSSTQRRAEAQRMVAPVLAGHERHIGPYVVIGNAREGSNVLSGWDAAMRRSVWIVPRSAHAPEASPARRSLSRLTRLRWVGGRRAESDSWDAFESPAGESLAARLTRAVPWSVQQNWLLDISNEFMAADADGTRLTDVSADSLWITPTDRIVFLETGSVTDTQPATDASDVRSNAPGVVIAQLFERVRNAGVATEPSPRYALRTIAAACTATNAAEVQALVQGTLGKPATVTRARRAGLIAVTLAPVLMVSFIGWFSTSQAMRLDRTGFLMSGLLSFVADSMATNADSVRIKAARASANPTAARRVRLALESVGIFSSTTPDTLTPPDTLRHQRHLAEVYLSTVLADRARDTVTASVFGNTPKEQRLRQAILLRNSTIDSAEARAARMLVDSTWKGTVPSNGPGTISRLVPVFTVITVVVVGAVLSLLIGLLFRRGPIMRGFQIDVVTTKGAPAGRLRMFVRNLVIWSVVVLPIPVLLLAPQLSVGALAATIIGSVVLYVIAWALAVWFSLRTPSRGLPERASGTWLVPD